MATHYACLGLGYAAAGWSGPVPDRVLWRCVLTGAADATTDAEIPISNIYARLYSASPSEHQVSAPYTTAVSDAIAARPNATVRVFRSATSAATGEGGERLVFEFPLEDQQYHRGAHSATYVLQGSRQTTNWTPVTVTVDRIIEEGAAFNGERTWTVPADYSIQPGDSVVIGAETILIDRVQFHASTPVAGSSAAASYLVLREAAAS